MILLKQKGEWDTGYEIGRIFERQIIITAPAYGVHVPSYRIFKADWISMGLLCSDFVLLGSCFRRLADSAVFFTQAVFSGDGAYFGKSGSTVFIRRINALVVPFGGQAFSYPDPEIK